MRAFLQPRTDSDDPREHWLVDITNTTIGKAIIVTVDRRGTRTWSGKLMYGGACHGRARRGKTATRVRRG